MLSTRTRSAVSFNKGLNNSPNQDPIRPPRRRRVPVRRTLFLMRRVFQNLIANAIKHTPLHLLVEKIIEENTNLRAEAGVKLERRHFDLWPLVEAIRTLAPDVPVTFSSFAFLRSRSGHKRC